MPIAICRNPKCPRPDREFLPVYPGAEFCSAACRREEKKSSGRKQADERTVVEPSAPQSSRSSFQSGDALCQWPMCVKKAVHQHHVVYEKHVEAAGGDVNDHRNAIGACFDDHNTHHKQIKKLPISCLHDRNLDFAYELLGVSASDYLRRRYAGDDERLQIWENKVTYGMPFDA